MAYNPLNPGKTNEWNTAGAPPPPGMLPPGPQGATLANVQGWGNPDVQAQQNPLGTIPTPLSSHPAPSPELARFKNAPAGPGSPTPAANPNAVPPVNNSGGTMTLSGTPGATATISPNGVLTENAGWRGATAPGTATGPGTIPGVGGTLNVMSPQQNAAISGTPQGGGAPGTGEVWAGREGQALREQLTQNMNLAMQKANAPYTAERGTSAETGGNRQNWANLAHQFGETLSGGMAAQGAEREAAAGHANTALLTPSEIEKNKGITEYYGSHGEAQLQNAEAKNIIANNQLEIAGLKAGAGKYGNQATAEEYLKGSGFAPNPQAIDAFNKGYKAVPGTKATKTGIPGFRTEHPAVAGHMIPPDWKPVMEGGKQKVVNGEPIYTDASGATRKPTIYGK